MARRERGGSPRARGRIRDPRGGGWALIWASACAAEQGMAPKEKPPPPPPARPRSAQPVKPLFFHPEEEEEEEEERWAPRPSPTKAGRIALRTA